MNIQVRDIKYQARYKDQYLRYLQGNATHYNSSILVNQTILSEGASEGAQSGTQVRADQLDNTFDSMLQSKQDEIILESLKVSDSSANYHL